MRIANRLSVLLCLLALFAIARPATAQSPATQPIVLVPATAPAAGPATSAYRYSNAGPYPYPDGVVTTYAPPYYPTGQFARGDFELSLGGQGFTARGDRGDESIGFVTFDAGWYFVPTLSVDFELGIAPGTYRNYYHDDRHNDDNGVRAVEELALLRWHFLTLGGLSLYADGGVGGMYASPDFPSDGRRNNFLAAVGGGVTLQVVSHFYLGAGARAAWLDGGDWDLDRHQHHWSDGVQYYGDLTFIFP
jgi:opacity protein-like surface antigen